MIRWEWRIGANCMLHAFEPGSLESVCRCVVRPARPGAPTRTCRTCSRMTLAAAPPEHPWWAVWIAATSFDREPVVAEMDTLLDELGPELQLPDDEPAKIAAMNAMVLFENRLRARYGRRLIRRDSTLPRDRIGRGRRVSARN